jgi:serine/threonine protein kinase
MMFSGHRNMLLERGILHRDVSLGNIMFDPSGGEKNLGRLIDFDMAKEIGHGPWTSTQDDFRTVCLMIYHHFSL